MMKNVYNDIQRINIIDPATPAERLCKLFEESGELAQAVNKKIGRKVVTESDEEVRDLILEEADDTIQCVISLIDTWGISYDELVQKISSKNIKWESVVNKRKYDKYAK
jgi:NTP pyrophosphatase (non-canonical NTP hydrolase)